MLTNGREAPPLPAGVKAVTGKIASLEGSDLLERVVFEDGRELPIARLFVAEGVAGSADLAKKIGAFTESGHIVVNEKMASTVPGLFAAGDCVGGLMQVAFSVAGGARAGLSAAEYVRSKRENG